MALFAEVHVLGPGELSTISCAVWEMSFWGESEAF